MAEVLSASRAEAIEGAAAPMRACWAEFDAKPPRAHGNITSAIEMTPTASGKSSMLSAMADWRWGLEPDSRLSCQAILGQQDITVEIPKYSINHAKEKH